MNLQNRHGGLPIAIRERGQQAFTLIEVTIALAISLITLASIFAFFVAQDKIAKSQRELGVAQSSSRVASDFLARDIRGAGFEVDNDVAIRIEQQCGKNPYTPAGVLDGCPNGSDRITLHWRLANSRMFGCDPVVCPSNKNGPYIRIQEPNLICTTGPGCGTVPYAPTSHPLGLTCEDSYAPAKQMSLCHPQGFPCIIVDVSGVNCNVGCGGGLGNQCTELSISSGNAPPNGDPLRNGGVQTDFFRTYQVMDLDADGSTELVMSDVAMLSTTAGLNAAQTLSSFSIIAPYVDDLQIAVNSNNGGIDPDYSLPNVCPDAVCGAPDAVFKSRNVFWRFEDIDLDGDTDAADYGTLGPEIQFSLDPTYSGATAFSVCGDPGNGGSTAAEDNQYGCSDTVRAVRFTISARTPNRVVDTSTGGGSTIYGSHTGIENNLPAPVEGPTPPAAIPIGAARCYGGQACGCGPVGSASTFARCTLSGNEPGYPRRILTNVVSTRNLQGGI